MQRLLVFLAFTLAVVGAGTTDAREPLTVLRQLCIADHGTGFNWVNGAWKQVNYLEPKYVVLKVDYPNVIPENSHDDEFRRYLYCTLEFDDETGMNLETFKSYSACLRVQEVGEEHSTYFACKEFHHQDEGSGTWTVKYSCSESGSEIFYMRPNGQFHKGYIHGNVQNKPKDDYKDSLSIFVGRCVDIES
ncbi:MAG: hypothetical protein OXO52_21200 [Rhodospirillales bacterium]|nr:hypothetical protein [Rhodospirillales bacterium]MDE0378307.1 hypothetical protein [Rhodospirillales bacterium]